MKDTTNPKAPINIPASALSPTLSRRAVLKAAGLTGLAGIAASLQLGHAQEDAEAPADTLPNGAGFYRFPLGEYSVVLLSDGQSVGGNAFPNWGANPDMQAEYAEVLQRYGAPIEPFVNNFNPMLVDTGDHVVLIDTGLGSGVAPVVGKTLEHLRNAGYSPEDIDTVFITHGHPDHIQGLTNEGSEVFPNAQLIMGESEFAFWANLSEPSAGVRANLLALQDRFTFIGDGDSIVPGLSAVLTPGHTAGHMSVLVSSGSEQLMHFGDAGGHYLLSPMFPEHYLGFDADREQVVATRAALFDRAASEAMLVIGYHYNWPGVGRIVRSGSAYSFAPAFWRWG